MSDVVGNILTPEASKLVGEFSTSRAAVPSVFNTKNIDIDDKESDNARDRRYAPHAATAAGRETWKIDEKNDPWLKKNKHWTDTPLGKASIEFVSRMTLGGIFFSLMENSEAMRRMRNYQPGTYSNDSKDTRFLEKIAYGLDQTVTKAMFSALEPLFGKFRAYRMLQFRENRLQAEGRYNLSRSLGAELTVVTASFAAMSAGTAVMRNILTGTLNPTERDRWLKDGKFDALHFSTRLGKKLWEIVSYNAGEDAAVALPYVFFMRQWRNVLNIFYPGFKYDSDYVVNGGGFVVKDGKVVDHYQAAGFWDMQGRFTVYNIFTQMYRDWYNARGDQLQRFIDSGFEIKMPEFIKDPASIPERTVKAIGGSVRYMLISSIRSILQMTPSVPFFSIFRVPASKDKGLFVDRDHGALFLIRNKNNPEKILTQDQIREFYKNCEVRNGNWHWNTEGNKDYVIVSAVNAGQMSYIRGQYVKDLAYLRNKNGEDRNQIAGFQNGVLYTTDPYATTGKPGTMGHKEPVRIPSRDPRNGKFNAYTFGEDGESLHSNLGGRITDRIGKWVHNTAEKVAYSNPYLAVTKPIWRLAGYKDDQQQRAMAKGALMAAIPYASYFSMKVLTRETYVNEQMNLSIGRMLDGLWKLDKNEFRDGIGDITKTLLGLPLENPEMQARLIENHRYSSQDNSPIPVDWDRRLHKEYLMELKEGKRITTTGLTRILNRERAYYYNGKALAGNQDIGISREDIGDFIVRSEKRAMQEHTENVQDGYRIVYKDEERKTATNSILDKGKLKEWLDIRTNETPAKEVEAASFL